MGLFLRTTSLFRETPPYCTAFHTSVVVDPDKRVRPCCTFDGDFGDLRQQSLREILDGEAWRDARVQVEAGEVPAGCASCMERERLTGWSVRTMYRKEARSARDGSWRKGLTELEINSSNLCNLSCVHCSTRFSSRWSQLVRELEARRVPHHRLVEKAIHPPDPRSLKRNLDELDLRHLQIARFKGGEPMLSADVPATLRHLDEIGVLRRITVSIVSNGSVVNEEVCELLARAKAVSMCLSVDGVGGLQTYLRRGPSDLARVERSIERLAQLRNTTFALSCSVMAYNVFQLDRIADWWNGHARRWPRKFRPHRFTLHVVEPRLLCVQVLSDGTRARLRRKYGALRNAGYEHVLEALAQPFAGASLHDDWVRFTRGMDAIHGVRAQDLIPDLASELVLLREAPGADSAEAAGEASRTATP